MSASTQTGETTRPSTSNGNGHQRKRSAASIARQKATAAKTLAARKAAAPQAVAGAPGIAPSVVAARRIGPVPAGIMPTTQTAPAGSLAWLYERQMALTIEQGIIRSMIASFRPGTGATATGTVRTTKRKKAKRKTAPARAA
jgi:hypothetical protein